MPFFETDTGLTRLFFGGREAYDSDLVARCSAVGCVVRSKMFECRFLETTIDYCFILFVYSKE